MAKLSGVSTSSLRDLKLENAGTWPLVPKLLAFALALALGALAIYYFLVMPKLEDINTVERNIANVEKEIQTLQATVKRFEGKEEEILKLTQELEEAGKILPLQQEQPQLIDDVAENALASELDLLVFRPGAEVAQEQFYELPITLQFSGDYDSVGDFMARVSSMERLVIPVSLKLNRNEDLLSGDLQLKTFRFREWSQTTETGAGS